MSVAVVAPPSAPLVGGPLDPAFAERFLERLGRVWDDQDPTELPRLLTADVVWIDPAMPAPAHGPAAVRAFMEDCWRGFPDLRFAADGPLSLARDAPVVCLPWRMTGTHLGMMASGYAPTRRRMDVPGIDQYVFRAGRVCHAQSFYDVALVSAQLGVLPAHGSTGERRAVRGQRLQVHVAEALRARRRRGA